MVSATLCHPCKASVFINAGETTCLRLYVDRSTKPRLNSCMLLKITKNPAIALIPGVLSADIRRLPLTLEVSIAKGQLNKTRRVPFKSTCTLLPEDRCPHPEQAHTLSYLVPADSLLLQLLKLPFQLCLALYFLLCPAYKYHFSIDILSIHFFHCLDRDANRKFLSNGEAKQQLLLLLPA